MKNKKIVSVAALIAAAISAAQAGTIASWNFQSDGVAVNNNPSADVGTGTASSIGMDVYGTPNVGVTTDDVLVGKSSDTGANGVANTSNTWRVRAQAGSNGAANGWSTAAPIGTQGAVFAASTAGFTGPINISFDWYATTQGEANLQLQYTTDGSTWHNLAITLGGSDAGLAAMNNLVAGNTVVGSYVSDNLLVNGSPAGQDWFTGLTATINDPLVANDANFAIEMVNASTGADNVSTAGTALNNNSGNWRFDNVSIAGVAAVPEPTTLALAGMGGLAVLALMRRRK
jgi:hypothetical protein